MMAGDGGGEGGARKGSRSERRLEGRLLKGQTEERPEPSLYNTRTLLPRRPATGGHLHRASPLAGRLLPVLPSNLAALG